ncbi:hypothetical protein V1291_004647 [Nitrobacteraceae bacterium AZCC 1564]
MTMSSHLVHAAECRGFEVLPGGAASSMKNFKSKSGTQIISLLVSL